MTTPALGAPPEFQFGPVSRTDLVRYAGASGDFNPLHHDETFARAAGLPGVMAHGMFSAGLLGSFLLAWIEERPIRRFKVRFLSPVWPGDILSAGGKVVGAGTKDGKPVALLALRLWREDGADVVTGEAEVECQDGKGRTIS